MARGLRSMTGYAQADAVENGWSLRVSLRSVNHRFLDLHLRVPEGFEPIEPTMRRIVREHLRRGHVDLTVQYEMAGPAAVGVNRQVASAYISAAKELSDEFGLRSNPDIAGILRLPGVIAPPVASIENEMERFEGAVSRCLSEALGKLDKMREQEAGHLREEMAARLGAMSKLVMRMESLAERVRPAFAKRLEARLKELLGENQIDPTRLAQEAAIAAERSDVAEELARLRSHVQQFESLLAGAADVGKKMDFLLQEMQREANTTLSKTPGSEAEGLEMTQIGLELKSEIEKLREQVQNIE
ncbi:MAG TPA: YicC/YloC family endoribonuclease [Candidatus Aquilonibacter sp.]|nr:YicC/YloC family endoribonuclease [Candidatus Aquilonibacter sp.]